MGISIDPEDFNRSTSELLKVSSARRKKRQEELSKVQQEQQQIASVKASTAPKKPVTVGGVTKGIVDTAVSLGGMLYDSTVGSAIRVGQNVYDAKKFESMDKLNAEVTTNINTAKLALDKKLKDGKIDKAKYTAYSKKITDAETKWKNEYLKTANQASKIDPVKAGGDVANTALNLVTLGTGGSIVQSLKAAGSVGAKQALKIAGNVAVKEGVTGAAYGVAGTMADKGKDATLKDYATNAGIGLGTGVVAPILGVGVSKLNKLAGKGITRGIESIGKTAIGKKIGDVGEKVAVAFQDRLAPVYRDFANKVDKVTGRKVNDEIRVLAGNVLNSSSITDQQILENKAYQAIGDMYKPTSNIPGATRAARKELEEAGQFISEKQQAINWNKVNPNQPQKPIPVGTPKQEQTYKLLNEATKEDVQRAFEGNLITEANYNKYMADTDYTRVQKNLEDEIRPTFTSGGGPNASINDTILRKQKLQGSTKESLDPLVSYYDWSDKITKEIQRQKLSSYVIAQRESHGLGKGFLRTADNVEASMAARGEAAQTRVLRNKLASLIKPESRFARRLQSELDKLNKQGLNVALKKGGKTSMQNVNIKGLGGLTPTGRILPTPKSELDEALNNVIYESNPRLFNDVIYDEASIPKLKPSQVKQITGLSATESGIPTRYLSEEGGSSLDDISTQMFGGEYGENPYTNEDALNYVIDLIENRKSVKGNLKSLSDMKRDPNVIRQAKKMVADANGQSTVKLGKSDTKSVLNSLVEADVSQLTAIKKKIANREPKLASSIDNIIILKQQHEIASQNVKMLAKIAAENADKDMTNKFTISTLNRGIREVYEDDPRIVNAIKNTGAVQTGALLRIAQAPSRAIQRLSTGLNLVFSLPNFAKDQVDSFILSKNGLVTHSPAAFMMGLKESIAKPMAKSVLKTIGLKNTANKIKPSEEYQAFLKYVAGSTRTDINRSVKKTATRAYGALGLKDDSIIRKLENVNTATENATRFQNFYGTLKDNYKKGVDKDTALKNAIQASRENSVDFGPSGDWAPILKIANPFANANIQGARSLARAFKERPVGTTMKIGATVLAPVAASTYYNLSDPKRAIIYDAVSESDKANNLIFITDSGDVVKLPLPAGVKNLANPVRGMIEAEYGMDDPVTFADTAKAIFDTFEPIPLDATSVTPMFARPIIEDFSNKNFFTGNEIVPEYLKGETPDKQVFSSTSQTYRDIADKFGISPLRVKNILQGYGSSVGEQSVSLFDQFRKEAITATKGKADGDKITTSDRNVAQQLKGRFFKEQPDLEKRRVSVFYETYTPIRAKRDKASSEITNLIKQGQINRAKNKAVEYNESLKGAFDKYYAKYKDNPTNDPMWDDMLNGLFIKTTENAFKARAKQ